MSKNLSQEYMRKRIEDTREIAELTMEELSQLTGYSKSLLYKYKEGIVPIMPSTYRKLMVAMTKRISKLYHGEVIYVEC